MISYIALIFSVISLLLWIVFAITIRRLFKKLLPFLQTMGIAPSDNLTYSGNYGIISEPSELRDAESEK